MISYELHLISDNLKKSMNIKKIILYGVLGAGLSVFGFLDTYNVANRNMAYTQAINSTSELRRIAGIERLLYRNGRILEESILSDLTAEHARLLSNSFIRKQYDDVHALGIDNLGWRVLGDMGLMLTGVCFLFRAYNNIHRKKVVTI